ncbi:MAG: hypothetical protein NWP31_05330 [Solirubrobacteraceae bacterium]|jgi:hypothetical protein|nr:hypothetical protein [Solirubrobacteraceae bacterium]MDP4673133.1 hypothetical protein [Solirubrobacteraceae bacterium]MDP4921109.1 hypothetical protein [Solirubrobacteraceae bacterium]MDP5034349.1 hypothetical protein [Solirubrobacteraceae bacterium]
MLFDLRGKGRRRTVKIVYGGLALLLGLGLVAFGIGGATSGGLVDAFTGSNGGSDTSVYSDQVKTLTKKVTTDPTDQASWAALTKAQVQQASIIGYDQNTQSYNAAGRAELAKGSASWEKYLALEPKKPDDRVASLMVNAYGPGGLNEPVKAAAALKVVIEGRGASAALYSQLAVLAYLAGDNRESKIAEQRALELTPANQRKLVAAQLATQRTQIDSAKAQAAQQQSQGAPGLGG